MTMQNNVLTHYVQISTKMARTKNNIVRSANKWIEKNKTRLNISPDRRSVYDQHTIWQIDNGELNKAEMRNFFNCAKISQIAKFKLLITCIAENRYFDIESVEKIEHGEIVRYIKVREFDPKAEKSYKVLCVLGLESLVTNYLLGYVLLNMTFEDLVMQTFA